ncbi:MAG: hypothetical protein E5V26_01890, partial [Mesorhizobium sp.]
GALFGVGDRLKAVFYERVDVEEDKWGGASSALHGILQRPELSGEYIVQEDGTISVPLLGSIPVANRSTQQVQADLAESFNQLLGRKGLVNILPLERPPIYVLGRARDHACAGGGQAGCCRLCAHGVVRRTHQAAPGARQQHAHARGPQSSQHDGDGSDPE